VQVEGGARCREPEGRGIQWLQQQPQQSNNKVAYKHIHKQKQLRQATRHNCQSQSQGFQSQQFIELYLCTIYLFILIF